MGNGSNCWPSVYVFFYVYRLFLRLLLTLDFAWEALSENSKKIMKIGMVKACMHVNDDEINNNQRTNGPVNAHLISCPSKAQNIPGKYMVKK